MILGGKYPIPVKIPSNIPDSICSGPDRMEIGLYKTLTCQTMINNNMTMEEINNIGVDLKMVMWSWADGPDASNLNFKNSSRDTILKLHTILQDRVIRPMFPAINWFNLGFTMGDLIKFRLPVAVLISFGVCANVLINQKAHHYGESWQDLFQWTERDWMDLKFDHAEFAKQVNSDLNVSPSKKQIYLKWGPKKNTL